MKNDIDCLCKSGEKADEIIHILTTRSWSFLRQLCREYLTLTGKSLEEVIQCEFAAHTQKGLLAIRKCYLIINTGL